MLGGSLEEYGELMRRYQDALFRLAYRITGRREDAEDAVVEAFVLAFSKLGECRDRSKFGGWVRKIAVNISLRRCTREVLVDELEDLDDPHSSDDSVEQEILLRAQVEEIQKAVEELPPAYRTLVVLRYEEEMELKDIAELLGEQPGAVYTRLHRARKMLIERLEVMTHEMC